MKSGTEQIDQMTRIAGPTHEQLRQPFKKTMAEHARDATLNWGRAGIVSTTVGHGDVPTMPEGSGVAQGTTSAKTTSTEPSTLGSSIKPVRSGGASGNQNMAEVINATKIW